MQITKLKLKNWRNFKSVDVELQPRQFIVGPNASGKSNLLDSFRFLHDIARKKGGGLQAAVEKRGGISKIRCLSAWRDPEIVVGVSISEVANGSVEWRYEIGIRQEDRGYREPYLSYERVWKDGEMCLNRPEREDKEDRERLKQTFLEQVNNNREFREIGDYFNKIAYMHMVPQLLRHSAEIQGNVMEDDPFGQGFLENVAITPKKTRDARLRKVSAVIKVAVPELADIQFVSDEKNGKPHLSATYKHWRSKGAKQQEDQFSDGTLRLMGLVWSLLQQNSLLLLEEPELSLHDGVVQWLAAFLYQAQRERKRQVLISTHSSSLLSDKGIGGEEVLMLLPAKDGTEVHIASNVRDVKALLEIDVSAGEVVIARTTPKSAKDFPLLEIF